MEFLPANAGFWLKQVTAKVGFTVGRIWDSCCLDMSPNVLYRCCGSTQANLQFDLEDVDMRRVGPQVTVTHVTSHYLPNPWPPCAGVALP